MRASQIPQNTLATLRSILDPSKSPHAYPSSQHTWLALIHVDDTTIPTLSYCPDSSRQLLPPPLPMKPASFQAYLIATTTGTRQQRLIRRKRDHFAYREYRNRNSKNTGDDDYGRNDKNSKFADFAALQAEAVVQATSKLLTSFLEIRQHLLIGSQIPRTHFPTERERERGREKHKIEAQKIPKVG